MNSSLSNQATRMRRIATSALGIVFVGMILSRWFEPMHPALGCVRAFCEAATVGALADWFAVVALFRHPLGIPIPHTAILPKSKARVGASLADFIDQSFLTPQRMGEVVGRFDFSILAADWLDTHASSLSAQVAERAPSWLKLLSDDAAIGFLERKAQDWVRESDLGGHLGGMTEFVLKSGGGDAIFSAMLSAADEAILANRPVIEAKIREEIPIPLDALRVVPGASRIEPFLGQLKNQIASAVAGKTIEKVRGVLAEAREDSEHALRVGFEARLTLLATEFRESPAMASRIAGLRDQFIASGVLHDFASQAWYGVRALLEKTLGDGVDSMAATIAEKLFRGLADDLRRSPETREGVNRFVCAQILDALEKARPHTREFVIETVCGWDADSMASRLEGTVGGDLQFIRLNGTLIGGCIGLLIHAGFALVGR